MTKKSISKKYINIVQDMYQEVKTNVKTKACEGATEDLPIMIVIHQDSALD